MTIGKEGISKIKASIANIALFLSIFVVLFPLAMPTVSAAPGDTIYVDCNNTAGPWNGSEEYPFQYIWQAIDHAAEEHTGNVTIRVYDGTYNETVTIEPGVWSNLTLQGNGSDVTTIDANHTGTVITISASWVTITKFTITNGSHGIFLDSSSNNIITNNTVDSNQDIGIKVVGNDNSVDNNTVTNNAKSTTDSWAYAGIWVNGSNNKIKYNNCSHHYKVGGFYHSGITIEGKADISNNISHNDIIDNYIGIILWGSENNIIFDNDIIGNNLHGISYLIPSSGAVSSYNIIKKNDLTYNQYGLHVNPWKQTAYHHNETIIGNIIENNANHGAYITYAKDFDIINENHFNNNGANGLEMTPNDDLDIIGFHIIGFDIIGNEFNNNGGNGSKVSTSYNLTISDNDFLNNNYSGIALYSSSAIDIIDNNISSANSSTINHSSWGIYLYKSNNTHIKDNTIYDNNGSCIILESSNNNLIYNNPSLNNSLYGVRLDNSNGNDITDNKIFDNAIDGIYLNGSLGSHWNNIIRNNVSYNNETGIKLSNSNNNNITSNNPILFNNEYGISLINSKYNDISNNTVNNCTVYGLYIEGDYRNNITENNTFNGGNICYLYDVNGTPIQLNDSVQNKILTAGVNVTNVGKITLVECRYLYVANNTISNVTKGIYLCNSNNITLDNNTIYDEIKEYGLYIEGDYRNNITQNNFVNGEPIHYYYNINGITIENEVLDTWNVSNVGKITLAYCKNILLRNNTVSNNDYGIFLWDSENITLWDNHMDDPILAGLFIEVGFHHNISQNNTANNETVYYFIDIHGNESNPILINTYTLTNTANNRHSNIGLISFANCSYLIIENNTLNNNYGSGLFIDSSHNLTIRDNNMQYNCDGLYLRSSENNTVKDNLCSWNWKTNGYGNNSGIHLKYTDKNHIMNNSMWQSHYKGIYLEYCESDEISDHNDSIGSLGGAAIYLYHSSPHIYNNKFDGEHYPIVAWYSHPIIENNTFLNGAYAINYMAYCNNSAKILNNYISGYNIAGILLKHNSSPEVCHNTITNINFDGIEIYHEDSAPYVHDNNISNVGYMGIQFEDSNAIIENNNIWDAHEGINVYYNPWDPGEHTRSNATITGNTIWNCTKGAPEGPINYSSGVNAGIVFQTYSTGKIINNTIYNCGVGIKTRGGTTPTEIVGNNCSYNDYGIIVVGSDPSLKVKDNIITWNTNEGMSIQNAASSVIVENNTADNNTEGISIYNSFSSFSNNIVSSNDYGFKIGDSSSPAITNNYINWSWLYGIKAWNSSPKIEWNSFRNKEDRTGGYTSYFDTCSNSTKITNNTYINSFRAIYMKYTPALVRDNNITLVVGNASRDDSVGIAVYFESNATVINNTISKGDSGIRVEYNSNASIAENRIDNVSYYGIFIRQASPLISQNVLESNYYGIRCNESSSPTIQYNFINWTSIYGIDAKDSSPIIEWNTFRNKVDRTGGFASSFYNCSSATNIINNTYINSFRGIYLKYTPAQIRDNNITLVIGNTSKDDSVGIAVYEMSNATVIYNTVSNGDSGIRVEYDSNATIIGNQISNASYYGIFTRNLSSAIINNNELISNNMGIKLNYSNNVTLAENYVSSSSSYGIYLNYSSDNLIYHNNITSNTNQAYDNTNNSNQWDNSYPSGGNYWSDYTGYDNYSGPGQNVSGSDGIGDTPYIIDADSQDDYPLMKVIVNGRVQRPPFRINSNIDFVILGFSGSGTQSDPWVIENYDINGSGYGYCIYVGNTTDYFVVRDCYLYNASGYGGMYYFPNSGLVLYNVKNGTIAENTVSLNDNEGIYLGSSSNNTIENNVCNSNHWEGIELYGNSNENNIIGNTVSNSLDYGIRITDSNYNNITGNTAFDNYCGIYIIQSTENNVIGNNASSNIYSGIYLLIDSINNTIINNYASNNNRSILLLGSSGNNITGNNVTNSNIGIYIWVSSNNNTITNNYISLNDGEGILLASSNDNEISNNSISNNYYGINITQSSNILVEYNTILYNNVGVSSWSSSPVIQYNNISYNNGDGIGNVYYSHAIIKNNTIINNSNAGISKVEYSNGTIDNNTISNNIFGIQCGSSSPIITFNNITHNLVGIECSQGPGWNASEPVINWNNIHNNSYLGVINTNWTITINAKHNYWGSPSEPQEGVDYEGLVDYDPWETAPIEEAGPS